MLVGRARERERETREEAGEESWSRQRHSPQGRWLDVGGSVNRRA